MSDLINRDDALDAVRDVMLDFIEYEDEIEVPMTDMDKQLLSIKKAISKRIKALPFAQPERKTAEWVYGEKDGADGWFCSECGFHVPWYYDYYGLDNIDFIRDFRTCPCCDSKMLKYTGMKE